jgi:histidinol-phosphate aminotransferase
VLATVPLYAPDPSPVEIDLSDNVNLWGVPPAAERVLRNPLAAQPSVYPRSDPVELREALARYAGVSAAQVVTGCGSDDVIDGALRAFAAPGEKVAYSAPSFSMLVSFARVNGLQPAPVPFAKDGDVDPDALLAQRAAITYVCSPNNPTGSGVSAAALERVVTRAEGLVLVDEAYGEFSGQTAVSLLARAPQLLVTRTLSKAFGLAGLRVGYGLAAPEVVQVLEKVRGPYKVNVLGERLPWRRSARMSPGCAGGWRSPWPSGTGCVTPSRCWDSGRCPPRPTSSASRSPTRRPWDGPCWGGESRCGSSGSSPASVTPSGSAWDRGA